MWQQLHIVVMDEPTNYLDRDALGAWRAQSRSLVAIAITHNCIADALKEETWDVPGTGEVIITGNRWGQGKKGKAEATNWDGPQEDTVDAMVTGQGQGPKEEVV